MPMDIAGLNSAVLNICKKFDILNDIYKKLDDLGNPEAIVDNIRNEINDYRNEINDYYSDINDSIENFKTEINSDNDKFIDRVNEYLLSVKNNATNIKELEGFSKDIDDYSTLINNTINKNKSIYFPNGVYEIKSPIIIKHNIDLIFESGAILKATSEMDYLIGINPGKEALNVQSALGLLRFKIIGGIFDCNNLAINGIVANSYFKSTIRDFSIINFSGNGIANRYDDIKEGYVGGAGLGVHNGSIVGGIKGGNVGIYSIQPDDYYNGVEVVDCRTGFYLNSCTKIDNCSCWLSKSSLYDGSIGYRIHNSSSNILSNCTSDTMNIGVFVTSSANGVTISNFTAIHNTNVINPENSNITPVLFFSENNNTYARIKVNGFNCKYSFPFNITNLTEHYYSLFDNGIFDSSKCLDIYSTANMYDLPFDNANLKLKLLFVGNRCDINIYNTGDLYIESNSVIAGYWLSFLPVDYRPILCWVLTDSNEWVKLQMFAQNNRYYLHNNTDKPITVKKLNLTDNICIV